MSAKDNLPTHAQRSQSAFNSIVPSNGLINNLNFAVIEPQRTWTIGNGKATERLPPSRQHSGPGTANSTVMTYSLQSKGSSQMQNSSVDLLPLPSLPRKFSFNMSRYGILDSASVPTNNSLTSHANSSLSAANAPILDAANSSLTSTAKPQADKGWALYLPYHVRECYSTKSGPSASRMSAMSHHNFLPSDQTLHGKPIVLNVHQFTPNDGGTQLPAPQPSRSRAVSLSGGSGGPEASIMSEFPLLFETWSVVGMVDISGYSALASQLFKSVSHAGEVLQRIVNEVFEPILDIIMDHGGDVVKFAGDAILVCWTIPNTLVTPQNVSSYASPVSGGINTSPNATQTGAHIAELTSTSSNVAHSSFSGNFNAMFSKTFMSSSGPAAMAPPAPGPDQCNITNDQKLMLTAHGIAACVKIARQMRGYTKNIPELEKAVKLDVHISLAGGVTHHVHVGNKGTRREYFLSGPATLQATGTIDKAKRGEVVLPLRNFREEALEPLKQWLSVETNEREGFVTIKNVKEELQTYLSGFSQVLNKANIELSSRTQKSVQEYLSDYALYRLFGKKSNLANIKGSSQTEVTKDFSLEKRVDVVGNQAKLSSMDSLEEDTESSLVNPLAVGVKSDINELRRIVVMFIKLKPVGEIRSKTDYLGFYQMCMSMVVSKLAVCEGQLRQFAVDDKADNGCTALCVWGLPPWSHEVEERFALKMALELKTAAASMNISMVIGIAAGPAFTGYVGNASRRDHTILGDCVNLAARYLGLATPDNCILCDDSVYNQEIRDRFRLNSLGKKKIKGKEHDIEVFSLVDRLAPQKTGQGMGQTLIKNDLERMLIRRPLAKTLVDCYAKWLAGEKVRIVIEGESGQGKSFLSNYLVSHAQSENVIVWTVQASEYDQTSHLHVFRALVSNLLNLTLNTDIQKKLQSFTDTLSVLAKGLEVDPAIKPYSAPGVGAARPWSIYETVSQNTMSTMAKSEATNKDNERYKKYLERIRGGTIQKALGKGTELGASSEDNLKDSSTDSAASEQKLVAAPQTEAVATEEKKNATASSLPFGGANSGSHTLSTVVKAARLAPKVMLETLKEFAESPECWLIYKALVMLDEDVRLIPLFRKVMPHFIVSDNSYTNTLSEDEKLSLLLECLQRAIDKISRVNPCCLIVDDCQWSDFVSWKFIAQLANKCPRLFILVVTRPPVEFRDGSCVQLYEKQVLSVSKHMPLEALSEQAVFSYVSAEARSFEFPAKELVRVANRIYHQSGGNLSIVARLVETFIRTAPKLTSRDSVADQFESLMGNVSDNGSNAIMRSIVLSQFDKLDNDFQEILKIASCMISGLPFSLQEVVDIAVGSKLFSINFDVETVQQKIASWDLFKFLTMADGLAGSSNSSPTKGSSPAQNLLFAFNGPNSYSTRIGNLIGMSGMTPGESSEVGFRRRNFSTITFSMSNKGKKPEIKYQFRHAAIQAAIYNSLLTEKRQALHVKIAKFYEGQLEFDNLATNYVIPIIFYHYSRTNCRDERFAFMELKAAFYSQCCNYTEARAVLQELILMAMQDPSLVHQLILRDESSPISLLKFKSLNFLNNLKLSIPYPQAPSDVRVLARLRMANWHYYLAEAQFRLNEVESCEKSLLKALSLLGIGANPRTMCVKLFIVKYATTTYIKKDTGPKDSFGKLPVAYHPAYIHRTSMLFNLLSNAYMLRKGQLSRSKYCTLLSFNYSQLLTSENWRWLKVIAALNTDYTFRTLSMNAAADVNAQFIESCSSDSLKTSNLESEVQKGNWEPLFHYSTWLMSRKRLQPAIELLKLCVNSLAELRCPYPMCASGEYYCRLLWLSGDYEQCMKVGRMVLDFGLQDESNDYMFSSIPCPVLALIVSSTELDCMSMLPLRVSRLLQKLMDQSTNERTVLGCLVLVFNMEVHGGDVLQASLRLERILSLSKRGVHDPFFYSILLLIMSRAAHRFVISCLESNASFFNKQVLKDLLLTLKLLAKQTATSCYHSIFDRLINEGFTSLWKEIGRQLPKLIVLAEEASKTSFKYLNGQQSIESSRRNSSVNFHSPSSSSPSASAPTQISNVSAGTLPDRPSSLVGSELTSTTSCVLVHQIPSSSGTKVFESLLNLPETKELLTIKVWLLELIGRHHPDAWRRQETLMQSFELASNLSARSQTKYLAKCFPAFLKS